jgi:hypothetical protein
MGKDAQVRARFADGEDAGRLQYEPPRLLFRGAQRRVFEGEALKGVRAEAGDLVLADGSRFTLGEKAAIGWADAILHPKGRLDKIGVKPGLRVAILGVDDPDLAAELIAMGAPPLDDATNLDLLFYAADNAEALSHIGGLVPSLGEKGALWVVSAKGEAASVRDIEIMAAARAVGLVDNKVVGFSGTHTALRFVRRRG